MATNTNLFSLPLNTDVATQAELNQASAHYEATIAFADLETKTDVAAITAVVGEATLAAGSTAVVKRALTDATTDIPYSYTAYVYNGTAWTAMDGNYSADNVILPSDIIMAGNYTSVGNYTKGSTAGTFDTKSKGKSIKEFLEGMLSSDTDPSTTAPSVNAVTLYVDGVQKASDATAEVGTTVVFSASGTFKDGSYTAFANQVTPGCVPNKYTFTLKKGTQSVQTIEVTDGVSSGTVNSGNFTGVTLDDGDQYSVTLAISYNASQNNGKTALGNSSDVSIAAGTTSGKTTKKLTAVRYSYYSGSLTNATSVDAINSAFVKGLGSSASNLADNSTISISLSVGAKSVAFAYPARLGAVGSVKDENAMGAEIAGSFTSHTVFVNGATAESGENYLVYFMNFADALTKANTYTVKI